MKKKSTQVVPKIDQVVTAMIDKNIKQLVEYGIAHELITEYDRIYVTNRILEILKKDDYTEPGEVEKIETPEELEEVLKGILDYAVEKGLIEEDSVVLRDILSGKEQGPKREIVLLNAGAALYIGKKADSIADGIALAAKTIDSGAAVRTLEAMVQATNA